MDGLATLAQAIFASSQTFEDPVSPHFEACELAAVRSKDQNKDQTVYKDVHVTPAELVPWHSDSTVGHCQLDDLTTILATIKIFVVHRNTDVSLQISESSFNQIFQSMGASPHALYYVSCDYDGCHYWNEKGYRPTWFVGTSIYALLWTFDQKTCHTAGIFIHRRRQAFQHFGSVLRAFANHAHVPQLLLFVIALHQLYWYDGQTTKSELSLIRSVEQRTGFGPRLEGHVGLRWTRANLSHDIHELSTWSQHIAELSGNFSNKMRHQRVAARMLNTIVASSRGLEHSELLPSSWLARRRYEEGLKELSEAVPKLERHMAVYADYLQYLKDRSDRLSTVLFALLTHEDAEASIELAMAMRRDGSSMKTIALMTMAFLPGTFFAALFSMPQRQEDAFWVYWICAVPATGMVFLCWLAFSERGLFRSLQTRVDRFRGILSPASALRQPMSTSREPEDGRGSVDERYSRSRVENLRAVTK